MEGAVDVDVEFDGDSDILAAGQDFSRVARTHTKAGYKDGCAGGHDIGVQEGFIEGLRVGCQEALHWGRVKGTIQAMLLLCQPDSDACAELMQLLEELEVKDQKQLPVSQQDTETCLRIGDVMNFEPSDELREIITRLDAIKESFLL
ncbi:protein YAE1 homolog [Halichondria panicea]|uniref:protein YAE1 homolog n=1 Tax=Halichondria panicea TaxID=6063 RepID=UPI00312B9BEB